MPASSNVCRQFQQGNRVACAAPGKLNPRFPALITTAVALFGGDGPYIEKPNELADLAHVFILRIAYQEQLWVQLRELIDQIFYLHREHVLIVVTRAILARYHYIEGWTRRDLVSKVSSGRLQSGE